MSPVVNGGKKKNGATIWVGSKTIKRWSCIRVLLSVQVSKFIRTCHTLHRLHEVFLEQALERPSQKSAFAEARPWA